MKLEQIVCDKTILVLTKEKKQIKYGEVFEIEDELRANEILAATYQGKPVARLVVETVENNVEDMKVSELKELASSMNIENYNKMKKDELIETIKNITNYKTYSSISF